MTPLKELMDERGIKGTWLAERAEITQSSVSQIITGKRIPTLPVGIRIARVLGVSVEELWGYVVDGTNEAKDVE